MRILRFSAVVAFTAFAISPMLHASTPDLIPDAATLMQLEAKAQQADQRERSFLYTELAHFYTELAGQQIASGDIEHASATLKHVEHYAELIHAELGRNSKRLKNSEMLMHETTHKLGELVHVVSSEDKAAVQVTLKQLDKVNEEILAQVFAH